MLARTKNKILRFHELAVWFRLRLNNFIYSQSCIACSLCLNYYLRQILLLFFKRVISSCVVGFEPVALNESNRRQHYCGHVSILWLWTQILIDFTFGYISDLIYDQPSYRIVAGVYAHWAKITKQDVLYLGWMYCTWADGNLWAASYAHICLLWSKSSRVSDSFFLLGTFLRLRNSWP